MIDKKSCKLKKIHSISGINYVIFQEDRKDHFPKMGCLHSSFIIKKQSMVLKKKIIFSILVGVIVIGLTQSSLSEESNETSRIAVDIEEFQQPTSKYDPQLIRIVGHIADYSRGENVNIIMIKPHGAQEEINTFASKKGNFQTLIQITQDSQIGIHELILNHHDEDIAFTLFKILEST